MAKSPGERDRHVPRAVAAPAVGARRRDVLGVGDPGLGWVIAEIDQAARDVGAAAGGALVPRWEGREEVACAIARDADRAGCGGSTPPWLAGL